MLVVSLLLSACVNITPFFGEKITKLSPGDNKEKVLTEIGRPDGFTPVGDGYVLKYLHKQISGWNYQYTDYYLFFDKDNQLVAIKNGEIKDKTQDVINSLNVYNKNLNAQEQLKIQQNNQLINNLNSNKPQKVIICKQGDLMCY